MKTSGVNTTTTVSVPINKGTFNSRRRAADRIRSRVRLTTARVKKAAGLATALIPPGEWSLDHAFDLTDDLVGVPSLLIALVAGFGGALALLAVFWRPEAKDDAAA